MEGLMMTAKLILGLSILVSLHEFGHFITAKWFKMKVDKFYLFFDFLFPVPTLLNFSLFKKKIGDTEYGLGWFPLGGYVSIAGMIDETQDASKLAEKPEPWEFRAKPAWQRLIVMLGGVIVNVILGIAIFTGLKYSKGYNYVSKSELNKNGIYAGKIAREIGFQSGDKIISVNDKNIDDVSKILEEGIIGENAIFKIERNGKFENITIPSDLINKLTEGKNEFLSPAWIFKIDSVIKEDVEQLGFVDKLRGKLALITPLPAYTAGVKKGDKIVAIGDKKVSYYQDVAEILAPLADQNIKLTIERNNQLDTLNLKVSKEGKIGIMPTPLAITPSHTDLSFGQSFVQGTSEAFNIITQNVKVFKKIFAGNVRADKALSGPVKIAQMYGGVTWDWFQFWTLTGLLSMGLAFMNLLPIPALDGGHALFLLFEMITGRPPTQKFQEIAQQVGTVILLLLMVFVLGNDIFKSFF